MTVVTKPALRGLHLALGDRVMAPALVGAGWYGFALRDPPRAVRLCSEVFRPCDHGPSGDRRQLGFAVTGLDVVTRDGSRALGPGDVALGAGFHRLEDGGWCWTAGEAALPGWVFRDIAGPALLVVRGFGREGAEPAPSHRGIFLAGDSWPADDHVERHVTRMLHPFLEGGWVGQAAMAGAGGMQERSLEVRGRRLSDVLAQGSAPAVLFGRSSGARVATLAACRAEAGVAAVVCMGFPFRRQDGARETARHAHLAGITVPTLIFQGRDDPYGGADAVRDEALSRQVVVEMVPGGHEILMDEAGWQAVRRRVLLFLAGLG